jgi:hypothetical protein
MGFYFQPVVTSAFNGSGINLTIGCSTNGVGKLIIFAFCFFLFSALPAYVILICRARGLPKQPWLILTAVVEQEYSLGMT